MASLIVSAVAKWNGNALKKGEKDISAFQKTAMNFAKTFAAAFSVQKIVQFGKASVQAFMADEKAAKSLEIALKNTGNGFAAIATEGFIARLQQTYKVLDDDLRPAFQTLLTSTGSVTESQKALELALNIAAGTGKDLSAVSQALAKGFSGQTTALSRLGAGLSKATLASGDMNKIMAELTSNFRGQALEATKTYAGQMAALGIAAANSKEIIGKGLLDALAQLGDDDSVTNLASDMENFATGIAEAIKQIGSLGKAISSSGLGSILGPIFRFTTFGQLNALGKASTASNMGKNQSYSATSMYFTAESAERAKNTAIIKKNTAAEAAKLKQSNAEKAAKDKALAEQKNLDELKKKFDIDRINLETALANSTDEAEKTRIRSLLTIMDDDAKAAGKRLAELDKAQADRLRLEYLAAISIGDLGEAAKLAAMGVRELKLAGVPLSQYDKYKDDPNFQKAVEIEAAQAEAASEAALAAANAAAEAAAMLAQESEDRAAELERFIAGLTSGGSGGGGSGRVGAMTTVNFNNPVGTQEFFTEAVKKAMQDINRYGDSSTYAGAIV